MRQGIRLKRNVEITLSCAGCGGNRFTLSAAGGDGDAVTCEECGRPIGTLGELKRKVAEAVLQRNDASGS